ncbi:MAG: acyltransferase [Bacteroidia bacterium]|nr:acyltransferase [Bacteroidia bacterium]MCC7532434.1 acyltransferase [Bacteroidia bacterium]
MGLIRLLLAVSVLILHTSPIFGLTLVGGDVAVQAFYMISGFYMSLVLTDKYETTSWKGYKVFITNRLLKLYPVYWFTIAMILTLGAVALLTNKSTYIFNYYIVHKDLLTLPNFIYFIFTNIFIVGQDVLFFIGFEKGTYFFQPDYSNAKISLHRFLFMKQAWTISLEIYFYLLVPFLNKFKNSAIILIICALFAMRFYTYSNGYFDTPWSYQFFPFELGFFLIGLLMHRWYKANKSSISQNVSFVTLFLIITYTFIFQYLGSDSLLQKYIYLFLFACSIPFIFAATKSNKIDRLIGETSYPIYIIHGFIGLIIVVLAPNIGNNSGILNLSISFVFAILFNQIVFKYIERYRQNRIRNK